MSRLKVASLPLGVDNAHFFLATNGKFRYSLKGNYDALKEVMADLRNGDVGMLRHASSPAKE